MSGPCRTPLWECGRQGVVDPSEAGMPSPTMGMFFYQPLNSACANFLQRKG